MKEFIEKWVLPVILLLAVLIFVFGVKPKGLASFIHTEKKKKVEAKEKKLKEKIKDIDDKISEEKAKVEINQNKIDKLKEKQIKYNNEVDNAKSDLDALDDMFSEFL